MKHFVYILYSELHDKYYKGYSTAPYKRLEQHNTGESRYTRTFLPWIIVYLELLPDKTSALKREKSLKKYAKNQIKALMLSPKKNLN
ncbi:putative endonuclease [Lishizhenia tianjinensis]|uniref:Putative endonuclease n=1 Tax=Lishizhenia tianjinensis TaxID=477690 RepID=A0A1I6Y9Z7_9FLAO|nr:GIY-YIG nuclease family protein [Lishizhenia tianjinensis]SFT46994.1 putative endonuclease [Lishizhenia tianjinensis]